MRRVHMLALGLVFAWSSLLAHAATDKKSFDVPAGVAPASLKQFAEQAGGHVLYSVDDVTGVKTLPVKGEFTPREALNRMLAGTTLYIDSDPQTAALTVRKETEAEAKNVSRAIAESSKSARPERNVKSGEGAEGEKIVKLDTFEVFGRKTLNMDIRRTRDDAQPYLVFDAKQINRSGALSIDDYLRSRLPMNTSLDPMSFIMITLAGYRLNGIPYEFAMYRGAHNLEAPSERLDSIQLTVDWMFFWLKGEVPFNPERAARWAILRKQQDEVLKAPPPPKGKWVFQPDPKAN